MLITVTKISYNVKPLSGSHQNYEDKFHIPKPKIVQQIRKPNREKSILYTISMTMMHPPATIKCLGEEKTICNLQIHCSYDNHSWAHNLHFEITKKSIKIQNKMRQSRLHTCPFPSQSTFFFGISAERWRRREKGFQNKFP